MLPFIKNLALTAVDGVIKAEPAFAGEVLAYLENNAAPAVEQYVLTKVPALLAKLQAQLQASAPAPANVIPLPAAASPAPGPATPDSPAASVSGATAGQETASTVTAPPVAAPATALGTADQPRKGGA